MITRKNQDYMMKVIHGGSRVRKVIMLTLTFLSGMLVMRTFDDGRTRAIGHRAFRSSGSLIQHNPGREKCLYITTTSEESLQKFQETNRTTILNVRQKQFLDFVDTATKVDESSKKNRCKRLPDIINIGVEKCGTGFWRYILEHHPMLAFPEVSESQFFTYNWDKGVGFYMDQMPEAAQYHKVAEKTPSYFNFVSNDIPERVKSMVPNALLVVILCDPVNRTYSDFVHEIIMKNVPEGSDFDSYISGILNETKNVLGAKDDDGAIDVIFKSLSGNPKHMLSTGLYYYHVQRWLRVFDRKQMFFIDGEELLNAPGKVFEELQDFMGVPKLLLKEDFGKGPHGFYGIRPPKVAKVHGIRSVVNGKLDVLPQNAKGRTRLGNSGHEPSAKTITQLRQFFRPYNGKLYKLMGRRFDWQ